MKIVVVLLFLLLPRSGAQAAGCESHLEVRRFEQVIIRMLRSHLNNMVTVQMRMRGAEELNIATLQARLEKINLIRVTPDGRTIDFSITGKGRQIALSLIALTDPEVMGTAVVLEWLRDEKPLRAVPPNLSEPAEFLEGEDLWRMARRSVRTLDLPVRLWNLLQSAPEFRIQFVGELIERTQEELLSIPFFGTERLRAVEAALAEKGLKLDMSVPGWRSDFSEMERRFVKSQLVIALEEWAERTPEKNRQMLRDGNYPPRSGEAAVTILTENGAAAFAVMQFEHFVTAKGYALVIAIRRSLGILSQHRTTSFYQRIFDWKRKEVLLPRLSFAQISGERGHTLLRSAFATHTPIIAGSDEGDDAALIFLPLDTE